ncbi:MAG: hypothetical protein FJW18_05840 [Actinobacteria bacterium]|nr:hypothetical protein [Actinomycetota bacterium]
MAATKSSIPTPKVKRARPRDGPRLQRAAADDDVRVDRLRVLFFVALFARVAPDRLARA